MQPPLSSFDSVLFFTETNFLTEPTSNRHHWARRFAKTKPVYFFQNIQSPLEGIKQLLRNMQVWPTSSDGDIHLFKCSNQIGAREAERIYETLKSLGVRRPLIWVYNPVKYEKLISKFPNATLVLHATENYFEEGEGMDLMFSQRRSHLRRKAQFFPRVDLLIAVSNDVAAAYRKSGYTGELIVITNGCDFEYWQGGDVGAFTAKKAIYQGGVNVRLDYQILVGLAELLPDWTFVFAGKVVNSPQLRRLNRLANVKILGQLSLDNLRQEVRSATVGLIPFRKFPVLEGSFPLKTYEYIASGLPVVSTPIRDLRDLTWKTNILSFAETSQEFAHEVIRLAPSRGNDKDLKTRKLLARQASYDGKFLEALIALDKISENRPHSPGRDGTL